MRNLLPTENTRTLLGEYYARLAIVGGLLLSLALVVGILSLTPSFLSLNTQERILIDQMRFADNRLAEEGGDVPGAALEQARREIAFLEAHTAESYISSRIAALLNERPEGIRVTSISFRASEGDGASSLTLSGVSATRENLIAFKQQMEKQTDFESVRLPVSNLAEERDLPFSVIITGTF